MQTAWHIGITGGIGSGKSTVAKILAQLHAHIVDADKIAHACTSNNGAAVESIRQNFGDSYVDAHGNMRRDAMRALVFQDKQAKNTLESIVHPIVLKQIQAQADAAERAGVSIIIYELPLLVESEHWHKRLHKVWVVESDHETQIQRCIQRNQLSRPQIEAILKQQASNNERRNIADAVVINGANTDINQLSAQIHALIADFGCIMHTGGRSQ